MGLTKTNAKISRIEDGCAAVCISPSVICLLSDLLFAFLEYITHSAQLADRNSKGELCQSRRGDTGELTVQSTNGTISRSNDRPTVRGIAGFARTLVQDRVGSGRVVGYPLWYPTVCYPDHVLDYNKLRDAKRGS
jgi:hypothetical protein